MSRETLRGKTAIIGIGLSPVGKVPGRSPLWLAANAAGKAVADAGIAKADIDGVLSSHAFASPFHRFSVAFSEYFGIQPTFSNNLQVSGASAATMFNLGAAAIHGGLAKVVLVALGKTGVGERVLRRFRRERKRAAARHLADRRHPDADDGDLSPKRRVAHVEAFSRRSSS